MKEGLRMKKGICIILCLMVLSGCTAFKSDTPPTVIGSGEACDFD